MDLMNCALGDSNERCRMAALQATSVILYGSKPFLSQASNLKTTASFTPFSVTLANMITRMFHKLSEALARERSLLVVTQILKCLTVLIQGTPFHRLKPGIIDEAITNVRRLVYHKGEHLRFELFSEDEIISFDYRPHHHCGCSESNGLFNLYSGDDERHCRLLWS